MNTFAFNPREKIEHQYAYILKKIKQHDHIRDVLKVGTLFVGLLFFVFIYLYFVSLASTRGYFLRQAMQKRTSISFAQDIIKTQILKIKQDNRENMKEATIQSSGKSTKPEVIKIQIPGSGD